MNWTTKVPTEQGYYWVELCECACTEIVNLNLGCFEFTGSTGGWSHDDMVSRCDPSVDSYCEFGQILNMFNNPNG